MSFSEGKLYHSYTTPSTACIIRDRKSPERLAEEERLTDGFVSGGQVDFCTVLTYAGALSTKPIVRLRFQI